MARVRASNLKANAERNFGESGSTEVQAQRPDQIPPSLSVIALLGPKGTTPSLAGPKADVVLFWM